MSEKIIDDHNRLIMLRDQLNNGEVDPRFVDPDDLKSLRVLEEEEFNFRG